MNNSFLLEYDVESLSKAMVQLADPQMDDVFIDPACGFRVIIMTQANSQVNTRVLELLPKFKIKK